MFYQSLEFWVAVALLGFIAVAWKPAAGAISRWLDAERNKIRAELDEAHKLRIEATNALADAERKQREMIEAAEQIILHAREEAARLRRQSADELTRALAAREQQGNLRIGQMEEAAIADLRRIAADITLEAVEQLLAERIDGKKAAQLADQAIADLTQKTAA